MGAVCCNHAPKSLAEQATTGPAANQPSLRAEHSLAYPHRHTLNDRSERAVRCLAFVESMSWEKAAGSSSASALTLPSVPGRK
jgi:hypothetical protein